MNLKTIRANSIHAAMSEARTQFGDDIVLVSTRAAENGHPAEIVVSVEMPAPAPRQKGSAITVADLRERTQRPGTSGRGAAGFNTEFVPSARRSTTDDLSDVAARMLGYVNPESEQSATAGSGHAFESALSIANIDRSRLESPAETSRREPTGTPVERSSFVDRLRRLTSAVATRLAAMRSAAATVIRSRALPNAPGGNSRGSGGHHAATTAENDERTARVLEAVDRRVAAIETALNGSIIGYDARWRLHPVFGDMVRNGLSPELASSMLATLAARGIPSDADDPAIRRDLVDELRRRMNTVVARNPRGRHVFVGPSGAGKTATVAGLVADDGLGRTLALQIDVGSDAFDDDSVGRAASELASYDFDSYDTILIDTDATELQDIPRAATGIAKLLAPLGSFMVHLVVDVRHDLQAYTRFVREHAGIIDAVAPTHLDALELPGRLAEFLGVARKPVYFASNAGTGRVGTHVFSPGGLAARVINADDWYTDDELASYFSAVHRERATRPVGRANAPVLNSRRRSKSGRLPSAPEPARRLEMNGRI